MNYKNVLAETLVIPNSQGYVEFHLNRNSKCYQAAIEKGIPINVTLVIDQVREYLNYVCESDIENVCILNSNLIIFFS